MKKILPFLVVSLFYFQLFSQIIDAGKTEATIDVSLSGAATYSVPISVPPGINNVVPKIALTYNSQSGNGIAGWGWNISGISSISRIPSTAYHDGIIDPIDLDSNDRYALDGQRLILVSGAYGTDGSVFQTENYSNIKIIAYNLLSTSPAYFKVIYPDGSIAIYGHFNSSSSKIDWRINQWTDPQGNSIKYFYGENISRIEYGGNGDNRPNKISFVYGWRKQIDEDYFAGSAREYYTFLKEIKVSSNGNLIRKYILNHNTNTLDYERLISIQETDGDNHFFPPIIFNYDDPNTSDLFNHTETSLGLVNVNANNAGYISSDFDGDTNMDIIVYPKTGAAAKTKYWYINKIGEGGYNYPYEHNLGYRFHSIFPTKWLTHNNKLLDQPGWTVVKEEGNDLKFTIYSDGTVNPIYYQYEKLVSGFPTVSVPGGCDYSNGYCETLYNDQVFPKEILSGDFNGDGLTDVIAVDKPLRGYYCDYDYYNEDCVEIEDWAYSGAIYFIDLKRDITTNFWSQVGTIDPLPIDTNSYKLETGDYNGDGKTDIFLIKQGSVLIYSLNENNQLYVISYLNSHISLSTTLMGDFNGDGNTDFMQPHGLNETNWNLFTSRAFTVSGSNGYNCFFEKQVPINLRYENVGHGYYAWTNSSGNSISYDCLHLDISYIANDINGDGKTDILKVRNFTDSNQCYPPGSNGSPVYTQLELIENKGLVNLTDGQPGYNKKFSNLYNYGINRFPIPIFLNHNNLNKNLELSLLSNNKIHTFKSTFDNRESVLIRSIVNDGVKYKINYDPLINNIFRNDIDTYRSSYNQSYPNINIQNAPEIKVVQSLELEIYDTYRIKQFSYFNAVANLQGLGFLGFESKLSTSWYNNDILGPVSNVTIHDFTKRGAISNTYNSLGLLYAFENIPSNFIDKTTFQYQTSNTPGQIFINLPIQIDTQNKLDDTSQRINYTYDIFNNVESITTNLYNGFEFNIGLGQKIVNLIYFNNPTAIDNTYHIGRIHLKNESSNLYNDLFTTEEEFLYHAGSYGNLVEYHKKKGHNTDWVIQKFNYNSCGNLTRKELLGHNRVEQFEYDDQNNYFRRFLTKSIDIEGLETTYTYDANLGTLKSTTDPYNNKTLYDYDKWGRKIKEIDYLQNETVLSYFRTPDRGIVVNIAHPNGQVERHRYNILGYLIENTILGLDNNLIYSTYNYDDIGRLISVSEPYFADETPTWTYYTFDQYSRPNTSTLPTGKIISTTYNGRSTSVNDGSKTVTTIKDANDKTLSLTDDGGTVNYTYYANGEMKTANYSGRTVSTQIDGWGRKKQLNDPDAGIYTYNYNDIGELLEETTPKGTTTYTYNDFGKIIAKTIVGDHTNFGLTYNYYNTSKLLKTISCFDYNENKSYFQYFSYDNDHKRLFKIQESLDDYHTFENRWEYDGLGRKEFEYYKIQSSVYGSNSVQIKNLYSNEGILYQINDKNSDSLLWHINTENAFGQSKEITLGNGLMKTRQINQYGFFEEYKDYLPSNISNPILLLNYNFNELNGNLLDRNRQNNNFNSSETFSYDNLDRLEISNSSYGNHTQSYDSRGRITSNSNIGNYNYVNNKYQAKSVNLNTVGKNYYQDNTLQNIIYNAIKKPISIHEKGKGRVNFLYNPISLSRATAYYGSEDEDIESRPLVKHYSSIVPIEITEDKVNGNVKITTFVGGDAYSAPIVHINETGANPKNDFYYLHRDYLGSILAITDSQANVVEQRQFSAWGNTDKFLNNVGDTQFNDYTALLNRGYTGHEHFFDVGLINMNGRMYDPIIGRMLSPDNFVENPFDTQSYNRYSYVRNNPLAYIDQNGEFPWLAAGVFLAFTYLVNAHANKDPETGAWSWNPLNWFGPGSNTNLIVGVNTNGNFTNTTVYGGVGSNNYVPVAGYNNNNGVSFGSWTPTSGANLTPVNAPDTEAQWMNTLNQEIADAQQGYRIYKWNSTIQCHGHGMNFDYSRNEWRFQMNGMGIWGYGFGGSNPRSRENGEYMGILDFTSIPTFGGGGAYLPLWYNNFKSMSYTAYALRTYSHIMERTVLSSYSIPKSATVYRYNFTLEMTTGQLDSVRVGYIFYGDNIQYSIDSLAREYQNDSHLMNKWSQNILNNK